ncbi:sulfatase-like hydrolase/transferase [Candidatus Laterigemmans baculatus]|uniref:sulfatase-like hydrolase/transferase n=1 Tax=Candidatus Laterigemmans baculatus TaxID=2770505 RepID=UPI0013DB1A18|nr:sulfatase-like hydrolase/transferase [Candidatus Laterigemmans baculatus]
MTRLCPLSLLVLLAALASTAAAEPARPSDPERAATQPNIVLILADDLGIHDLSCYGRRDQPTPHLDRLAEAGLRFTSAYTAQPICSPSRAALMTGKSPARLHLTNYLPGRPDAASQKLLQPVIEGQLPLEEPTIAEWLHAAGYATGLFGKWHLGNRDFGPDRQGFETVFLPPANSEPSATEGGKHEYAITAAAEKFIEENHDRPFFCYVPHHTPHIRLAAKPELVEKHASAFHPTYAAMMETLDDTVGRLMDTVDRLGLEERTIFIFTSDNGGLHVLESAGTPATHNTPFRAGKGFVYEGGLREPLIIRWPETIEAGTTSDAPVVLTDLVPTLLEAAGVDVAKTAGPLDGASLLGLLRGQPLPERSLYWHFPNYTNQGGRPAGAIRRGDWKLIEHFEDGSVELFDLASDPGETRNLAGTHADTAEALQAELSQWRTRVGAQMPTPNPDFDPALHRQLYVEQDPSQLRAKDTAAAMEPEWKSWRAAMNAAIKGRRARVTPPQGDVRLLARDAIVHAKTMRYEPEPHKNVLGYWIDPTDWAEWKFDVPAAGRYEVEVQQGCGKGSGGAEVAIEVGGEILHFTVQETGHFQQMILRTVGTVELAAGPQTLAVKPQSKPGPAVMDLRRIVLRPR